VKWAVAWGLALLALGASADTAFVSDELVLGVYAEENNQGQRLATLHSGSMVETLSVSGEFTQVRLNDGTTGWVKSTYLTNKEPAVIKVKQLEEELDRRRATTPALAEAAARNEVLQLQRQLAAKQAEIDEIRAAAAAPAERVAVVPSRPRFGAMGAFWVAAAVALSLLSGFWLGWATLARKVKHKFGGIKVY
jgi:phage protein D